MSNPKHVNLKLFKSLANHLTLAELYPLRKVINKAILSQNGYVNILMPSKTINKKSMSSPKTALITLLNESWKPLFLKYNNTKKNKCVYIHTSPTNKGLSYVTFSYEETTFHIPKPFYIGQGLLDRPFEFKCRSKFHQKKVSDLLNDGFYKEEIVHIIKKSLSEREARELESKLILFFGCHTGDTFNPLSKTGNKGSLINHQYEPFPDKYKKYTQFN